ncbi:MAG: rhomboid family intramembrane serine protease [Sphingobacteriales bacterium]|nr:MAG: rhomboid family intramembrane serine protease [Sphingobacteriales bacterium]
MITISLIVLNVIISLIAFSNGALFSKLCFYPYEMNRDKGQLYRFITGGFVHADFQHLLFNMITLWFFGSVLEMGSGRQPAIFTGAQYITFYFSALVVSSIPEYIKQRANRSYVACGASGAVSALMMSMVLFQPWGTIGLMFIIPLYFILFAVLYIGYSWYRSRNQTDNIGHGAHFWGALYGLAFTLVVQPSSYTTFIDRLMHPPFLH